MSLIFDGSPKKPDIPPLDTKHQRPSPDEYSEVMRNEQNSRSSFQAFVPKPFAIHFNNQTGDEIILLLLRRHPITQVGWILTAIILALTPFGLGFLPIVAQMPGTYVFAALVGWYLMLVGFVFESFLTWFFNVYIITDERIIDVDFFSLIYKNVSIAKIDNIEDITSKSGGVLQSLFNYGTVFVQTAGQQREFDFEDVLQPAKVMRLLNELILEEEREKIEGRVS
jgi:hypothetical protein